MNSVLGQIELIRRDRVRGASELALQALDVLGRVALEDEVHTAEQLVTNLRRYARLLLSAKPAMAAITNTVRCFEKHVDRILADKPALEQARCRIAQAAREVADAAIRARSSSILQAAMLAAHWKAIATCSFSSTVVSVLAKAREQGGNFKVLCLESATGGLKYGELATTRLKDLGVSAAVVPDSQVNDALREVDAALIGSDSVFSDGSVVNGYPSLLLAKAAAAALPPVPFYSVTDWTKVCASPPSAPREPGFDFIHSRLIAGIITEEGLLAPSDLPSFIESL